MQEAIILFSVLCMVKWVLIWFFDMNSTWIVLGMPLDLSKRETCIYLRTLCS